MTCLSGVVLYRNNGDGTFTDVTKASGLGGDSGWATGAAFTGDYDGDGWADLFISHYVWIFTWTICPHSVPARRASIWKSTCSAAHAGLKGLPDNLYHNNGDGTFTDASKKAGVDDPERRYGLTALWSDFNNDGKLDLFVTNDGQANYLYQGDGTGKFTDVAFISGVAANEDGLDQANMGVAIGDYLHTGRMSLLLSHFDNEYAALYRNDGAMNFTDTSIRSGASPGARKVMSGGETCLCRF